MKIYNIFIVFLCGISYFNIKSGCCGNEADTAIDLELYKFTINKDKVSIKYIDPSENIEYREGVPKKIFINSFFYVKSDKDYLNGLILMKYYNDSVDDDSKESYKIVIFNNYDKCKEKDTPGAMFNSCLFKRIKFLEYNKDNVYNLNDNADEYFKNIKDKKVSKILFLDDNKIKQCKEDNTDEDIIAKPKDDEKAITLKVKVPNRLLK